MLWYVLNGDKCLLCFLSTSIHYLLVAKRFFYNVFHHQA